MPEAPARSIAICCSGQGSNLQAILGAIRQRRLRARVAVAVSDNPKAPALRRARAAGVATRVLDPAAFSSRERFDRALWRIVEESGAKLIVLAGFMRVLSPWFVRRYRGRILNIHPALLPAFPGCHAVRDALRKGVKVTGVTVHFVDEQVDHGPIVAQVAVPIHTYDTEATLLSRIHRVEHRLYPAVIEKVLHSEMRGRKRS